MRRVPSGMSHSTSLKREIPRCAALPILALDVASADRALALVDALPAAEWVKVGLQLFIAGGPDVVRSLIERERRVFLDLKLHDIPNTVARAVDSAADLGVDLLTLHASGGAEMMEAAAGARGSHGPLLFAVTVLTSLGEVGAAQAWGREALNLPREAVRLAHLAADSGVDGVVCSVHEAAAVREAAGDQLRLLTPGIRLPGGDAHDQSRVATPADAARLHVDFLVIGRAVTAAAEPEAALARVLDDIAAGAA